MRPRALEREDKDAFDLEIHKHPIRADVAFAESDHVSFQGMVAKTRVKFFAFGEGENHGVQFFLRQSAPDASPPVFAETARLLDRVFHECSIRSNSRRVRAPGAVSS